MSIFQSETEARRLELVKKLAGIKNRIAQLEGEAWELRGRSSATSYVAVQRIASDLLEQERERTATEAAIWAARPAFCDRASRDLRAWAQANAFTLQMDFAGETRSSLEARCELAAQVGGRPPANVVEALAKDAAWSSVWRLIEGLHNRLRRVPYEDTIAKNLEAGVKRAFAEIVKQHGEKPSFFEEQDEEQPTGGSK